VPEILTETRIKIKNFFQFSKEIFMKNFSYLTSIYKLSICEKGKFLVRNNRNKNQDLKIMNDFVNPKNFSLIILELGKRFLSSLYFSSLTLSASNNDLC